MRKRALLLSGLFVLSLGAVACGGTAADIKKVGVVTDVGTLEDKSFNEASWVGAQAGAKVLGGTANNIVTKDPKDYAANIQTFVDQGYDVIVTVGFAMGDATTIAAKADPNVKFIGVDQGVCVDENGKATRRSPARATPKTLLPNYQGLIYKEDQAGYLAGIVAASISKTGVIGAIGGINTSRRFRATSTATQRRQVGQPGHQGQVGLRHDRLHQGVQRPGHRQDVRPADSSTRRPTSSSRSPARPATASSRPPAHAGHLRHRRRRRPVDVPAARRRKCIVTSAEKKLVDAVDGRDHRSVGPRPTPAARPSATPRRRRSASGCRPFHDYKDLDHRRDPGQARHGARRHEGRHARPCKPTACGNEGLTRRRTLSSETGQPRPGRPDVGPFVHSIARSTASQRRH